MGRITPCSKRLPTRRHGTSPALFLLFTPATASALRPTSCTASHDMMVAIAFSQIIYKIIWFIKQTTLYLQHGYMEQQRDARNLPYISFNLKGASDRGKQSINPYPRQFAQSGYKTHFYHGEKRFYRKREYRTHRTNDSDNKKTALRKAISTHSWYGAIR